MARVDNSIPSRWLPIRSAAVAAGSVGLAFAFPVSIPVTAAIAIEAGIRAYGWHRIRKQVLAADPVKSAEFKHLVEQAYERSELEKPVHAWLLHEKAERPVNIGVTLRRSIGRSVYATEELMDVLPRDEMDAVLDHEMRHLVNKERWSRFPLIGAQLCGVMTLFSSLSSNLTSAAEAGARAAFFGDLAILAGGGAAIIVGSFAASRAVQRFYERRADRESITRPGDGRHHASQLERQVTENSRRFALLQEKHFAAKRGDRSAAKSAKRTRRDSDQPTVGERIQNYFFGSQRTRRNPAEAMQRMVHPPTVRQRIRSFFFDEHPSTYERVSFFLKADSEASPVPIESASRVEATAVAVGSGESVPASLSSVSGKPIAETRSVGLI